MSHGKATYRDKLKEPAQSFQVPTTSHGKATFRDTMNAPEQGKKKSVGALYNDLLVQYPLLTNGIQSAIIAGLAVITSQYLADATKFDLGEVNIMMLINFAYMTPLLIWFNGILQRANLKMIPMLVADQLLFSPLLTAGIVACRLLLLGVDIHRVPGMVWDVVPKAMISSWMFWVPAKALIFAYVPPVYQLLAGSALSFIWTIIFAMILSK